MRRIALLLRELGPIHRLAEAREDGVLIGTDHQLAVAAAVDVGGRQALEDRAATFADNIVHSVIGDQAFHDLEHGLVQRAVDDLAPARPLARVQRGECTHAAIGGRETIADRHAHAARRPIRLADDGAPAAHCLANAAEARP